MNKYVMLLCAAMSAISMWSADNDSIYLRSKNEAEVSFGATMATNANETLSRALFGKTNLVIDGTYTRYLTNRLGASFNFSISGKSYEPEKMVSSDILPCLPDYDNYHYQYPTKNGMLLQLALSVGLTYRFAFHHWRVKPMMLIGYDWNLLDKANAITYTRTHKESEMAENVTFKSQKAGSILLSPGVKIQYEIEPGMLLGFKAMYNCATGHEKFVYQLADDATGHTQSQKFKRSVPDYISTTFTIAFEF